MSTLYLQNFKLEKAPFAMLPDASFFYEGERRGAVLEGLAQAVHDDAGLTVVTGEVGTGKTMLCRLLAQRLAEQGIDTAFVPVASLPRDALVAAIAADLGLDGKVSGGPVVALQQELQSRASQGRRVVVLIDEAHALRADALDDVRMLMNVETSERKLLQIVLFGQPELDELLARHDLRQVRDRVVHRFVLKPLSRIGARAYLEHRLRMAGWRGARLIDESAMKELIQRADGRFRALGMLADKSFLAAYGEGAETVTLHHVRRAWQELRTVGYCSTRPSAGRWGWSLPRVRLPSAATAAMAMGLSGATVLGVVALQSSGWAPGTRPGPDLSTQALAPSGGLAGQAGSLDYESLLRQAPPGAIPPRAGPPAQGEPYYTLQIATVATQADAEAELLRLEAAGAPTGTLFVRQAAVLTAQGQAPMWSVCSGRYATKADAFAAKNTLAPSIQANRPLVLKASS